MIQLNLFNFEAFPKVSDVWTTHPLARRSSTCSVCGTPIAIGSKYTRIVTIDRDALLPKNRMRVVRWHLPHCPQGEA